MKTDHFNTDLCSICNRVFCKKDCLPQDPVEQIADFVKVKHGRGGL